MSFPLPLGIFILYLSFFVFFGAFWLDLWEMLNWNFGGV